MQNKDWSLFEAFAKKNLVKSFIINKRFNKFWFKKKRWSILIKKTKNQIQMLNMFKIFKAKFFKKKINLCWASTAMTSPNYNSAGIFGLSMFHLSKIFPILLMSCGNKTGYQLTNLWVQVYNPNLRRFIFSNNIKCIQMIKLIKENYSKKNFIK